MAERFGLSEIVPARGGIWVHAVSVGEVIAAVPVIRTLQKNHPNLSVTVTTTTPTGSERVMAMLGDSVCHVYMPYDWPLFIGLFLRRVRPKINITMETELWPMTFLLCRIMSIPVLIANARLSEKSASGYGKVRWLVEPVMQWIAVAAQNSSDGDRFLSLGLPKQQLTITGSIKFDIQISMEQQEKALQLRNTIANAGKKCIWIAASTHKGEDEMVLAAHRGLMKICPDAMLILVPRHPERFSVVATMVTENGMQVTRKTQSNPNNTTDVWVVDTIGDLFSCYGVSDFAFIGGSLLPVGGHNVIEPAVWGQCMITGPHTLNFKDIVATFVDAQSLAVVADALELEEAVIDLYRREGDRKRKGLVAQEIVEKNSGANEKLQQLIAKLL